MIYPHRIVCLFSLWITACSFSGCERADRIAARPEKNRPAATEHAPVASSDQDHVTGDDTVNAETFQLVELPPESTGIDFEHVSGNSVEKPFPAANGSGVGALDCDLDGHIDLYFVTGAPFPLNADANTPSNRLYRNLGEWRFQDVSVESGLDYQGYSSGVAVGDINSDGFPDVYVTCFGENQMFVNNGDGTFAAVRIVNAGNFSTSAAFLDFDNDGLTDLYVCNYGKWSWEENPFCGDRDLNVRIFCSPKSLEPEPDRLLRNNGDGSFKDVSESAGISSAAGRAQGVLSTDLNADGKIDLYVGNDIHPNFLFLNEGDGKFRDITETTGTAYDSQGRMQAGMGVAGADVNRDGKWDLFVTNFEGEFNTLYLQSAADDFYDASVTAGLATASKQWVGWGAAFADFDLDGWMDVIVTNGHVDDNLKKLGKETPYEEPPLVWKNEAGHFRFLGGVAGSYFQTPHPGRGLATADLDNDGDIDVVITQQDLNPALLRNDNHGQGITLRLIGVTGNRDSTGCRVRVASSMEIQYQQIQGGGSYLSASDSRLVFSADPHGPIDFEVAWASGIKSVISDVRAGQAYDIIEPSQFQTVTRVHIHPAK